MTFFFFFFLASCFGLGLYHYIYLSLLQSLPVIEALVIALCKMSTTTPTLSLSFLLHRIPWALFGMLACYMCFLFIKPDLLIYLRELLSLRARPCSGYGGCSNKQDNRRSQPPWRIHSGGEAEKSQTPCFYFSEACLDHHILRKTSLLLILLSFLPTLCPPLFFFFLLCSVL